MSHEDNMANEDQDQLEVPLDIDTHAHHAGAQHNVPLRSRCMVHKLGCLIKMLSEDKKATITSWGFGGLLHAAAYSLRTKMVEDLVACMDPGTGILSVHGRALRMTQEHAGFLLGLPSSGGDVNGIISHAAAHENFGITRTSLKPVALYDELTQIPNGIDFDRKLLLYIVGTVIRPTGNVHISTSYLSLLGRMDEIKTMNWAMFAFEGMLAAVRTYKNGRARGISNKCIGGCIWLLQLFYLEHLAIGVIHQPIIDREPPRVSFWTDIRITRAVKHVKQQGGVGARTVEMFTPSDHAAHTEAQDINELKSKVAALQREVEFLRSHVTISLVDVRRDIGDLIYRAVAGVREDLASQGKEIDAIRRMLHDFMARAEDGTKTGVGAPERHREEEANNVSQDHVKVTASPVVISSTDVDPVAAPIPEIGVTQDIQVLQVPRGARTRKDPIKGKMIEEPKVRVISPSIDSSTNYPLQQSIVATRRDTLRSANQRIPGAKKRSPYTGYPMKEKAKQVKIAPAIVEAREATNEAADANHLGKSIHDGLPKFINDAKEGLDLPIVSFGVDHASLGEMQYLQPRCMLSSPILDVAAGALTCEAREAHRECHRWYFPSRFSRTILSTDSRSIDVYVDIFARKHPFMVDVYTVRQIFVPVNDRNFHWYLVVLDVPTKKTYIVDSLPSVDQTSREDMATKIAGVIEAMCKHVAATHTVVYDPSWPHSWPIEHLPVKRQPNLHDCGLYVIAFQRDWDLLLANPITFGLDRNYRRHVLSWLCLHKDNLDRDEITRAMESYEAERSRLTRRRPNYMM